LGKRKRRQEHRVSKKIAIERRQSKELGQEKERIRERKSRRETRMERIGVEAGAEGVLVEAE